jgi:uncharacterized membrane protein (UPF0127 family)
MAENNKNSREEKPPLRRQPRINQRIIYLIVAIAVLAWVIITQVRWHGEKPEGTAEKKATEEIQGAQTFKNQGELSFQLPDGKIISQIQIEVADNASKISQGLMYRERLGENQGMLFIFPDSEPRAFWMKNTILPLDMIFADSNGNIVTIQEHTIPLSQESYISEIPAKYVVEVNAGYANAHNIKVGDKIVWKLKKDEN